MPVVAQGASRVAGDINGDGYQDLVVSAPDAVVNGRAGAGAVVVVFGGANGPGRRVVLTQNSAGVPGSAEAGDRFGASVVVHDLDGNGYNDLVIGAPGESVTGDAGAGSVTVVRGASGGLGSASVVADPWPYDHDAWGRTLAVGKFEGLSDGGRPVIAVGSNNNWIYYVSATAGNADLGGFALGFNPQYGVTQLVGTPGEALVVSGRGHATDDWQADGEGSEVGTAVVTGGESAAERAGGLVAAVGDLDGDGLPDLVTGNPFEPGQDPAGALGGKVTVTFGGGGGGPAGRTVEITQNTGGVPGGSEAGDRFGAAVSIGDTDRDGFADLVIGAPGEDASAGAVTVIRGSADGLDLTTVRGLTQNTAGVPGGSETGDGFGGSVLLRDITGDGRADLTVGGPGEDGGDGALWFLPRAGTSGVTGFTVAGVGLSTSGTPHFGSLSAAGR
ncbi:integrin alpha [Streptomyces sp. NPDC049879]|uniref:integrin alpha n=1 Tax=Streptomyces sp. NPDC049879 TaxID=3365598 RepID=UPI0037AB1704